MHLKSLSISNFKNFTEANLEFSGKINCFFGNNGVGKTNLLDAIYYLSFCKSYFNPIDSQNILHEEPFFAIHGKYRKNGNSGDEVSCVQKRNRKKLFKLNKKEYSRLADHIGLYPLVMISPADRDLINQGSEERRKYIDSVISQFDKIYLDDLIQYNKVLTQRNTLLKKFAETNTFNEPQIEIWDEQLVRLGDKIFQKRKLILDALTPLFQNYYEFISGGREKVEIEYESHLNTNNLSTLLKESVKRDCALQYTTVGIHKDDLLFRIDGYPVKKFASQGQQKSFLMALKLAQFEYTKDIKGFKPVLLFDDIFDKLDHLRVERIMKLVNEDNFGQVFITDTQKERIEKICQVIDSDYKIFEINNGCAEEIKPVVAAPSLQ